MITMTMGAGLFAFLAGAACSSTSDTGPAPGVDAGMTTDSGGGGNDAQVANDAHVANDANMAADTNVPVDGNVADVATASPDCTTYCTEVMANCMGPNTQYIGMANCLGVCAAFPPGKLGDTSGDTLGCRQYHGGAPSMATPATHCPHAGPTGGDNIVSDILPGTCGEGCEAFCAIEAKVCTGANQQYADTLKCMAECKTFASDTGDYSTADTSRNDFGCRMYHLSAAAGSATLAATHCPHTTAASTTCTGM